MTVSHKDWELPNSRTWLAEIYIKSGLDFPIWHLEMICGEKPPEL